MDWYIIPLWVGRSLVLYWLIDDAWTLVHVTGFADCTYYWNKGATALCSMHPLVTVIDDVGIVLSCNIQDDLFLY